MTKYFADEEAFDLQAGRVVVQAGRSVFDIELSARLRGWELPILPDLNDLKTIAGWISSASYGSGSASLGSISSSHMIRALTVVPFTKVHLPDFF